MASTPTTAKPIPGGRVGVAQPQMLVATVESKSARCSESGWDGADAIATDWFATGGSYGTVYVEDNTEAFDLRVEVVINPVLANGAIDFDASTKYTLGTLNVAAGIGGHFNIDVVHSHFRLVHVAPDPAPTAAFNAFFWKIV